MQTVTLEGYRLSPQQKHLWLLQNGNGHQPYRTTCAVKIDGCLNHNILQRALQEIVDRFEILRTSFQQLPGMALPLQIINRNVVVHVKQHDLLCLDPEAQQGQLEYLLEGYSRPFFNLEQHPLFDCVLIALSEHKHILVLDLPALCVDAAGTANLVREIATCYEVALHQEILPDDPMQYVVASEWLNELVGSDEAGIGKAFWLTQKIDGFEQPTLPFEIRASIDAGFEPAVYVRELDSDLTKSIDEFILGYETSEANFFLACWVVLLARIAERTDVLVGIGCDGRTDEELYQMIGLFSRTVALHSNLNRGTRFNEVLDQVSRAAQNAYTWQECFSWTESTQSNGSNNEPHYFYYCYEYGERPEERQCANVVFSIYRQRAYVDRFKLKLSLVKDSKSYLMELHYDANLFVEDEIERLLGELQSIVKSVLEKPGCQIGRYDIQSSAERQLLLVELNDTARDYPDKLLHEFLEEQTLRTPDSTAVVFEDQQITYDQLNRRANQLANYLVQCLDGSNSLVAICVERSLDMLTGIFGVLKAGAAYLPLDPFYPAARISFMLESSGAQVVLTQSYLEDRVRGTNARVVRLDADRASISQCQSTNPHISLYQENIAYVIYTSGSTGLPKGAMISHRAICNHMFWMKNRFLFDEGDAVIQKTPFSFDASVWEFYATLMVGGRLIVARPDGHKDSRYLVDLIQREQVTTIQLVPTLLRMLVDEKELNRCNSLTRVFCGGEVLTVDLRDRYYARSHAQLINLYGPTEATIDTTYWVCEQGSRNSQVPVGVPVDNAKVYLLDREMMAVPVGVAGEILIGGKGLGEGYLNQPALTAEKFIPDLISGRPGARLYCTGDLGRHGKQGWIDYIGRTDQQVKHRGHRIELGEIESTIGQHPAVKDAVVMARREIGDEVRLVAYLVFREEMTADVTEMRQFLLNRLPDYALPTSYVTLGALPQTPNGKIDRGALPDPDDSYLELRRNYIAPTNPVQEVIVSIWSEVLDVERISIQEDFFELGGQSLIATQVISRMKEAFKIEVPLRKIFESRTVEELASEVEKTLKEQVNIVDKPISPLSREQELPLSFAQQRLWFLDQLNPNNAAYNLAHALRLTGELRVAVLEQSFNEIVRRHETLRTIFRNENGEPALVTKTAMPLQLIMVDLDHLREDEREDVVKRIALEEAQRPFDLSQGPLLRLSILNANRLESALLVTMHHIASDGWSMGILVEEVIKLYESYEHGRPSPLEDLRIQYGDYAVWQRDHLRGDVLEQELGYWSEKLSRADGAMDLPTDRPRPVMQTYLGGAESLVIGEELCQTLGKMSRAEASTLYMVLLTAFEILLYRMTGSRDVVIGTPIAGRRGVELEKIIGLFVNTLVMKGEIEEGKSFRGLLKKVREEVLEAYAHQDVPFEQIIERLNPERNQGHSPLIQVMFAMQNAPSKEVRISGLKLSGLGEHSGIAKFDLQLNLQETGKEITMQLEYNADLFDASTIRPILRRYRTLLQNIINNPDLDIDLISMADESEQTWVQNALADYNRHETITHVSIQQMFYDAATRFSNNIAISSTTYSWTYAQLDSFSNKVANFLIHSGAAPGSVIGIVTYTSSFAIASILAILKARCVFVTFDTTLPGPRVEAMVNQVKPDFFLVEALYYGLVSKVAQESGYRARVICLDSEIPVQLMGNNSSDPEVIRGLGEFTDDSRPRVDYDPDDMCYIYFTSGSTGRPKAIAGRLKGIDHFIRWEIDTLQLTENTKVSRLLSFSFDGSLRDIFAPLACGGTICITEKVETMVYGRKLVEWIDEEQINLIHCVPSVFRLMVNEQLNADQLKSLKYIVMSGEPISPKDVERWMAVFGERVKLVNLYGTSETTMAKFVHFIKSGDEKRKSIPVGRPMPGAKAILVDNKGMPCAHGMIGEIYIRTPYITHGYYRDEARTKEVFIRNPFSDDEGDIVYKSGDIARLNEDGDIELIGRKDGQVKIRGVRVELGEIEGVIRDQAGIQDVVVVEKIDKQGNKYLASYMVGDVELDLIREAVKKHLPEYMVPSKYVKMEALPKTISGKVDRKALLEEEGERSYREATNEIEARVTEIWMEVLGAKRIGIDDHFFEIGGHSLLAMQVISRIRAAFKISMALCILFETPTIASIAAMIANTNKTVDDRWLIQSSRTDEEEVLEKLDELSNEEVESLLEEMLAEAEFNE